MEVASGAHGVVFGVYADVDSKGRPGGTACGMLTWSWWASF